MKKSRGHVAHRYVPSHGYGQSQEQRECGEGGGRGESLVLVLHLLRVASGHDPTTYGAIRLSKFNPLRGDS